MANTLFLRLEGPLQSWGERAKWDVRDTAPEPTKSGVVGLLACALGLNTDGDLRDLSQQLRIGVRCDRPGTLLMDYHTIVGGVMGSTGKVRPGTIVSRRTYLCDASFLVAVRSTSGAIVELAQAVQSPTWPLYLGRRSCPASRPPFEGVGDYPTLEAALGDWPWYQWEAEPGTLRARAVIESQSPTGARRRDEILSRSRRTFGPRYTYDVPIIVKVEPISQEVTPCTSPA
jgi:CRISPR system Cascade subunit CasD